MPPSQHRVSRLWNSLIRFLQSLHPLSFLHLQAGQPKQRRSPALVILLLVFWSVLFGWGLSLVTYGNPVAQASTPVTSTNNSNLVGTVDLVPRRYQLGQELYLENCATCHLAVPPAVLPTETWRRLLQDTQHYGRDLPLLVDPPRLLVWNYLRTYSRPLTEEEKIPYRIADSRYFQALHPKVTVPRPLTLQTCITCHPGASRYNFRQLTPELQDAP